MKSTNEKVEKGTCWICSKYVPHTFVFHSNMDVEEQEIFLHLNIDDWRPDKMKRCENNQSSTIFKLSRYVPHDFRVEYFFSDHRGQRLIDSTQNIVISEKDRTTFPNRAEMIGVVNTIRSSNWKEEEKFDETCLRTPWSKKRELCNLKWSAANSNFQNRAFTSYSRNYVDSAIMWKRVQDKDWCRIKERVSLLRMFFFFFSLFISLSLFPSI